MSGKSTGPPKPPNRLERRLASRLLREQAASPERPEPSPHERPVPLAFTDLPPPTIDPPRSSLDAPPPPKHLERTPMVVRSKRDRRTPSTAPTPVVNGDLPRAEHSASNPISDVIRRDAIDTFWEDRPFEASAPQRRRRATRPPDILSAAQHRQSDHEPTTQEELGNVSARIANNIERILKTYQEPRLQKMLNLIQEVVLYEKIRGKYDQSRWERIRLTPDGVFWQQGEGSPLEMARGKGQHDLSQPNIAQLIYNQTGVQSTLASKDWTEDVIWSALNERINLGEREEIHGDVELFKTIGGAFLRGVLVFPPLGGLIGAVFIKSAPGAPFIETGLAQGMIFGGVAGLIVTLFILVLVFLR